ncbi:hypothetical protein [Cribrihabitans pelagius]|uniref:hypothetical protein n=1 Tax=Cribrihabitans pelagius TaxID=1765746 RepID=UPI003B59B63C
MKEYEVRVLGTPPQEPHGPHGRRFRRKLRKAVRAVLLRPRRLVLAGMAGFVLIAGTPHIGWDYQCRHPMRGPGSCSAVGWCAYYGIQGRRIAVPSHGSQCSPIKLLPLDWNGTGGD